MKKSILLIIVILLVACSTADVEEQTIDEVISETETTVTTPVSYTHLTLPTKA